MPALETLDLNHLRILAMLLDTQSVTRAARQLGISQPSVSRALAALRKSFQDPLLVKTNAGMTLTQRAVALREPLMQWLAVTQAVLRNPDPAELAAVSGKIRLATTDYGVLSVLEPALPELLARAPDLCVDIMDLSPENLNQLSEGVVDIVISGWEPEPGRVHEKFLFQEGCCCIFRKGHPLEQAGGEAQVTFDDLLDWPHIVLSVHGAAMDPLAPLLKHATRQRRIAARMPYLVSVMMSLQKTDAIFVGPVRALRRLSVDFNLTARPMSMDIGAFGYWLYWHERSRRDPVVMWFIDVLARAVADSALS